MHISLVSPKHRSLMSFYFSSDYNILLTTGTKTSKNLISERNLKRVIHQYFPWDSKSYCDRFLNNWRPDIAIFLESEIWPNHLIQTKKREIPIILVNARMTEKSQVRWFKFKKTISHLLSVFSLISWPNVSINFLTFSKLVISYPLYFIIN